MNLLVKGTSGPLAGEVEVPYSKYHAHRALILASLAPGRAEFSASPTLVTYSSRWTCSAR